VGPAVVGKTNEEETSRGRTCFCCSDPAEITDTRRVPRIPNSTFGTFTAYTLEDSHWHLDSSMPLWQELISLGMTSPSLALALKALLGSREDLEAIYRLTGTDAQRVVDFINQVCSDLQRLTHSLPGD
jgi:hypothetical protein